MKQKYQQFMKMLDMKNILHHANHMQSYLKMKREIAPSPVHMIGHGRAFHDEHDSHIIRQNAYYKAGIRVFRTNFPIVYTIHNESINFHNILGPSLWSPKARYAEYKLFGIKISAHEHAHYRDEYLATPEKERENYLGYLYSLLSIGDTAMDITF